MERVFIVGSGRCGTTILQSFLAAHPRIVSFPESLLYAKIRPKRGRRWLRVASRAYVPCVRRFLKLVDRTEIPIRRPIFMGQAARHSTALLDRLALDEGGDVWIEKTPYHIYFIALIERYVPRPKFIHSIRDGADVVASIVKLARRYEQWNGPPSLDAAIERRNSAVAITEDHSDKPNHLVIHYESLMTKPEEQLRDICSFIGVQYDPCMTKGRREAAQDVIDKPWKEPVTGAIDFAPGRTFQDTLTSSEQEYVLSRLVKCSV